jgi:Ca2+/Na+ antiporter
MIGRKNTKKSKRMQLLDDLFNFMARIYTTLIYSLILFFSLWDRKICIFVFVYLIYFFIYFIRINKTFLGYMIREDIEKIIDLKLDYFYEKYLSKCALKN